MDRVAIAGAALFGLGLAGYVLGIAAPYPGRSLSITAVMFGCALLALGGRALLGEVES